MLWELVHVFFEHRGLLEGRRAEKVHDSGASAFLYPFLGQQEHDLEAVVADVRASVLAKAAETGELRVQTLSDGAAVLAAAAAELRAAFAAGGRLLALGNGGSATDAMDVVADFHAPLDGGPARPAIDLTEDTAILTALANDIGPDAMFARQVIAHGRPGDVLLALSTSGTSGSVIAALEEARRRGLRTIAMVGYDGGRVLSEGLADHVVVSRSEHIPRIQEAQASAYHALQDPRRGLMATRVRARVQGTVQGVGFRPYVYRLARDERLGGWVRNDERGVVLEVEGAAAAVERFLARLPLEAPPLAAVERVRSRALECRGEREFAIVESAGRGPAAAPVAVDTPPCEACLAELADPADRRHRYPFVNCTDCGPRFTIVRGVPYDRARTTMAGFAMCAECRAEYEDPLDRRFHAEPNACPVCGPRARLVDAAGRDVSAGTASGPANIGFEGVGSDVGVASRAANTGFEGVDPDAVAAAAGALRSGLVVAVKGAGGYHLACRADDDAAVAALRSRKHREDKPFALMAADLDAARALVELTPDDEALLTSRARPIVIARRRAGAVVAAAVAPGRPDLGVMLPSTPLHHLLLADAGVTLVMTSGNVSDEPIAYEDGDALERLARDRRPVPGPRPADRDAHGRLGRPRPGPRSAARAGSCPRASSCPAPSARCSPAAPSSRARSASPRAVAPGSGTTSAT